MLVYAGLDEAYCSLLDMTLSSSARVSPRGVLTRELSNVLLKIESPRQRFVTNSARKWSLRLAFGELAWHLSGSRDVNALASYAQIWRQYSKDSTIRGSCYGHKIFAWNSNEKSQWERCKEILQGDSLSRRAVIQLYDPDENYLGSPDVSCVMNLQFAIRAGVLDMTLVMRSNDVYFGFPYDVHFYASLQELMAAEIGVELGAYFHFATSLHLYEKDVAKAERVLRLGKTKKFCDVPLRFSEERKLFCLAEESLREGTEAHLSIIFRDEFWRQKYLYLRPSENDLSEKSIYAGIFNPELVG